MKKKNQKSKSEKFPYTRFDKAYGFETGEYRLKTVLVPPEIGPSESEPKILVETDVHLEVRAHWFFYKGIWQKIDWDSILDPINLRLRREFNEELQKYKGADCKIENSGPSAKDRRRFIYLPLSGPMRRFESYHARCRGVVRVSGGFYCEKCRTGYRYAEPVKKFEVKSELDYEKT